MLDDASLDEIARRVAASVCSLWRDDVRQDAWLRFLRYQPQTRLGAWLMARSARDSFLRRQRTRVHGELGEFSATTEPEYEVRERLHEDLKRAQLRKAMRRAMLTVRRAL